MAYSYAKSEKTENRTNKNKEQSDEGKNSVPEYEEEIQKLIKLVDKHFKPIGLKDLFKASEMFRATIIAFIVLYVYIIILTPFTPISVQIPWALSFAALILAAAALMRASRKYLRPHLVNQQFRRMYPLLNDEREQTKLLLVALLTMKIENPSFNLFTVYEIEKELFDKKKLLERLYE